MKLLKRKIQDKIYPFIDRTEAIIIKGTRRVGKTSLLFLLKDVLKNDFNIKEEKIYFFDLEKLDLRFDFNDNPENILKYLKDGKDKKYIFIDEIQYLDNPANFLKILVDHYPFLKIFATGSSSLDIKRKIQDSLIGRVIYFHLYPLSFFEYLNFKNEYFSQEVTENQRKKLNKYLKEYLTFGAMPSIVLEPNIEIKKELLKSYTELYISKDIRSLTEIENIGAFNNLIKIVSSQLGNLLDKSELASTLNINFKTVDKYLDILKYTYIINFVCPYFLNIRSRLTKQSKIFFYDLGIRNSLLNDFNDIDFRIDNGFLFENFIYLELLSFFGENDVFFYRTQKQSEIDFIINSKKIAIEVKYKKFKDKKVFRVFDSFNDFDNYILNLSLNLNEKNYSFIDWWNFLNKILK